MQMAARSLHVKHSICSWPHCFRWQQQALLSVISGAVVVSSLVAVVCAAAQIPLTCNDNSRFLTKSLKTKGESIAFQCPEGLTFVPNVAEQESCADSTCNKKRKLLTDFITLEPTQHTLSAAVQQQSSTAPKVTITLKDPEEESSTLYFLCKKLAEDKRLFKFRAAQGPEEQTTCTLQVSAWGKKQTAASSEHQCTTSKNVNVTLDSQKQDVTFSCGDMTLSPANFENALEGEACDTENDLTSLGLPDASLVEGSSGTENKPAYTFNVSSLPAGNPTSICYKCKKRTQGPQQRTEDCTVRIKVKAEKPPHAQPEGDDSEDGATDGTQTSTEQTSTSGVEIRNVSAIVSVPSLVCLAAGAASFS
uniref:SRS domain containing protein, putative n=1 Tax=Toxoplasma gondii (strain ATCC 50861 / VEG) TaxID=432359 RepID=A0A0F7V8S4_TOXGV|nr:TPA: SRS domain containing protein, putative [Toxoplasma gondii VEG]